ncbi:alpha/beta-hydrolase [Polychaeton citri CBS 116435]|uniref:Alpha/beta-hydrolase n=1 Tax=Polychaeton citri CBS 116435 TaxID=1314669 RepID=A0A9P4Q275_9PEZI|nr:alpha/beta-hydrolase [Polychaeton citri CBS 116435]
MLSHPLLAHLGIRDRRELAVWLTAPVATFLAFRLFARLLYIRPPKPAYRSPRQRALSVAKQQSHLEIPYPLDALPGSRDVDTPFGNIRVFEWGPETGRKVLFVHGISTPCIAFASMARQLVERGCRVMVFDLFGRGYSDSPDPRVYRQDIQLFTSQILLVLASSPIAWTGSQRFALIGYSMGGGIAAAFTSYFPDLVESLVLITPSGLMRPHHISWTSRLIYSGFLPQKMVELMVSSRLGGGDRTGKERLPKSSRKATQPGEAALSEVPGHPALTKDSEAPILQDRPNISIARAVGWQIDNHPGFLRAFISSIQHAPIANEHDKWRRIGQRQEACRHASDGEHIQALNEGRVLILLGKTDSVIDADEVTEDATIALGKANVRCEVLSGGHDLPFVNAESCVGRIIDHWSTSTKADVESNN